MPRATSGTRSFSSFMRWLAVPILLIGNVKQDGTDARKYHVEGHVDESEL